MSPTEEILAAFEKKVRDALPEALAAHATKSEDYRRDYAEGFNLAVTKAMEFIRDDLRKDLARAGKRNTPMVA